MCEKQYPTVALGYLNLHVTANQSESEPMEDEGGRGQIDGVCSDLLRGLE